MLSAVRDAGGNFFDNAEVYAKGEAEVLFGKAMRELGWRRSDVVLSTKIFWGGEGPNDVGLSRKHVVEGLKASLKRMQVEYVDVVFAHRPDPSTPIEETVRAFNYVIDSVRAKGERERESTGRRERQRRESIGEREEREETEQPHRHNHKHNIQTQHTKQTNEQKQKKGLGVLLGHVRVERRPDRGGLARRRPPRPRRPLRRAAAVQPVREGQGGEGVRPAVRHEGVGADDLVPPGFGGLEREVLRGRGAARQQVHGRQLQGV